MHECYIHAAWCVDSTLPGTHDTTRRGRAEGRGRGPCGAPVMEFMADGSRDNCVWPAIVGMGSPRATGDWLGGVEWMCVWVAQWEMKVCPPTTSSAPWSVVEADFGMTCTRMRV